MHFIKFETKRIHECLEYVSKALRDNIKDMKVRSEYTVDFIYFCLFIGKLI